MLLGKFLWYLVIGWMLTFTTSFIHVIRAELKGYKALEWWTNRGSSDCDPVSFFAGLIIWPIKLCQFIFITIPDLYETYELKNQEKEH